MPNCQRIQGTFTLLSLVIGPISILKLLSSLGSIQPRATVAHQNLPSTLTGTHLYTPGWREALYSEVSSSRTQVPWSRPGCEPTFWRLGHQNTSLMCLDRSAMAFNMTWNRCPNLLDEHSDWKLLAQLCSSNGNMTLSCGILCSVTELI